jgi:hypothetical protein
MWHLRSPGDEKMTDITTIPEEQLKSDLLDCIKDIVLCKICLALGIFEYSGGFIQARLTGNEQQAKVIEAELARRGKETK